MNALQFYHHMRHICGISPRLAAVATMRRYANPAEFFERYGRICHWFGQRETPKTPDQKLTAALTRLADTCRDDGYGAARRDKLGLKHEHTA